MDNTLESKEIDLLIEALEAWESRSMGDRIASMMIKAIIIGDKTDPVEKQKYEEKQAEEERKINEEHKQRKETSLLLKAKLVGMKYDKRLQHNLAQTQG